MVGVDRKRYLSRMGIHKKDARKMITLKDAELDAQDVVDWLQHAGFGKYAENFIRAGISNLIDLVMMSSKGPLVEMGLIPKHADLLLTKLGNWREKQYEQKRNAAVALAA